MERGKSKGLIEAGLQRGREYVWPILAIGIAIALLWLFVVFQVLRPLPSVPPTILQPESSSLGAASPRLPFPGTGSATLAIEGVGAIGSSGPQSAQPLASTAKIMAGLVVLTDHPLELGQDGPTLTVSQADVDSYQREKADGQSVLPVAAGEQLTEYQALEALLIPSGNNVGELLASWDAGSVSGFVDKMNATKSAMGLRNTTYADVNGLSAQTSGSPHDLIMVAETAMRNPVFARIVGEPEANLPVAGRVFNVNADLGQDGIIGVKTGSSAAAGACLVFAANVTADQEPARIYGAIMGLPTLDDAFSVARNLIEAVAPALHSRTVLSTLQTIAEYEAPWGDNALVFSQQDLNLVVFDGMTLHLRARLRPINPPAPSGTLVGYLTVQVGEYSTQLPMRTTYSIDKPDLFWRITRTRII
jgi:D-alanyl-D-alanine carboxypeptidase (penicillin-binding protein 5/6)